MPCLFGDATQSELEPNYLHFLRDFVEFAVAVLRAREHTDEQQEILAASERTNEAERAKLAALQARLERTLRTGDRDGEGVAERCTEAIERACNGVINDEIDQLERELDVERANLDRARASLRRSAERALEKLLLAPHTLPESGDELTLTLTGETGYEASLLCRTPYGLEVELDLAVPPSSLMAAAVRASQVAPSLELHVPEQRGWLSKKTKLIKHKVHKHVVTRVVIGETRLTVSLRQPDSQCGFDIMLDADWVVPRIATVKAGEEPDLMTAHNLEESDEEAVRTLMTTLADAAEGIRAEPTRLARATFDGKPIMAHDDPTLLVDRLLEIIAPTVQSIASHSLGSDELVLKRDLGAARREETYLPKQALFDTIDTLRPASRARFEVLGLRPPPPVKAVGEPAAKKQAKKPQAPARAKARGTAPPPPPGAKTEAAAKRPPSVVVSPALQRAPKRPSRARSEA